MMNRQKKELINKKYSIVTILILFGLLLIGRYFDMEQNGGESSFRALPRPIAKEPLLITSAGQSTDIYVVKDIANKLMLDNYFIPLATNQQIEGMESVVMVVGYSEVGIRLNELDFKKEKNRVGELLNEIADKDISLITIYLRGKQMLTKENRELLSLTSQYSDYLIVVEENGTYENFSDLAQMNDILITIVDDIIEVSEPFVSAFR